VSRSSWLEDNITHFHIELLTYAILDPSEKQGGVPTEDASSWWSAANLVSDRGEANEP
jgi:hypothetical protein